jgi:hypothetical protein
MKMLKYAGLAASSLLIVSILAITGCKNKTQKPADSNAVKQAVGTGQRRPIDQINALSDSNEVAATVNGFNITEGQIRKEINKTIEPEIERLKKGSGGQPASADVITMVVNSYMKQLRDPVLERMILRNLLDPKVKDAGRRRQKL